MNSLQPFPLQQDNDTHLSTTTPLKRTRAKRSCDFCRKRKSRCDADSSTPCSNCKAWGYTCEFETVRKKRGPPSVYVDNLEKKCKKMESLLATLTQCSIEDLERNDFQYNKKDFSIQTDTSSEDEEEIEDIANHYDSIKYTGQSSTGLNLFDIFKSRTSIPWPGRENTLLKLMSEHELMIVRTEKSSRSGRLDTLLDIGLSMKSPYHLQSDDLAPLKSSNKPARHQLDKIVGIYFSHLHLVLPIINKNKFLSQYHHSSSTHDSILVQSVLALTFRFASKYLPDQKEASEYCDGYFKKVLKRLKDSTRSKLSHVQAALLMVLYLDMEEGDVESLQWHTLGQAIRMAQDLGLHRSCTTWNLPRSEIETRHRVFYVCYVMDRWHGARTGKPLTILDRDFDTDLPSPYEIINDESNSESGQGLPIYRKFILLIHLSEILGRVLKALYAPNSKIANLNANLDGPNIVSVFHSRLNHWKASLDEPLDGVFLSELDKLNLKIYCSTVVLLLHRPFSNLSVKEYPQLQQEINESEKICTETALELNEIVTKRQDQTIHPAYYTIFCTPSCFVYALLQSCLVFFTNALKTKSISDAQMLHQSIDIMKKYSDIASASHTLEILNMLISINSLDTISEKVTRSKISPIIPIKAEKSKLQPFVSEQVPKSFYFQQRSLHDNSSDLKMAVPNPQYYIHNRRQQVPVNCFVQNYPVYSNTNVYSHQRSISLDQLNSSQQQMYTHHARSISHDDLGIITGSFHRPENKSSEGMNVNNMLSHGYSTDMMAPFNPSIPPYSSYDVSSTSSNLNWSDWDVYMGHQNSTQENISSSPQHIQYS